MKRLKKVLIATALSGGFIAMPAIAEEDLHTKVIQQLGSSHWMNKLTFSGILEVEARSTESYAGADSSDISLATAVLTFDAKINTRIDAHLSLLYEEDETPLEVDEATIVVMLGENQVIVMGQMYLPLGVFETSLISDPLTLQIAETRETAIQYGFANGGFKSSVFAYNGTKTEKTANEKVDQFGLSVGYSAAGKAITYDVGVTYMNNLADADGVTAKITATTLNQYVGAYMAHAIVKAGAFSFISEYLKATDNFASTELAFNSRGARPGAINIELDYGTSIVGKPATWAIAYQATDEALALALPKSKILLGLSLEMMHNSVLSFEVANSEDYAMAVGGSGKNARSITAQFAVGF